VRVWSACGECRAGAGRRGRGSAGVLEEIELRAAQKGHETTRHIALAFWPRPGDREKSKRRLPLLFPGASLRFPIYPPTFFCPDVLNAVPSPLTRDMPLRSLLPTHQNPTPKHRSPNGCPRTADPKRKARNSPLAAVYISPN
jgi:hypothetical protein